jgi:Peptidase_C39 like family
VNAPNFAVSASPSSRTITQGQTTTYTVTVNSVNGFSGSVSLFALNLPGNVVLSGTGFSPQTVNVPSGGSASSTFTYVSNTTVPTGTFTVTMQGQGGGLTRSTTVSLTVNSAADFTVSASPSSRTIAQGQTTTYTITINSVNGFSGSVSLFGLNLPGNVVLPGTGFSPQTVNVPSGGSASSTFTYVSNTSVPNGTFTVTMQGQNGGLARNTTVTLTVNSNAPSPVITSILPSVADVSSSDQNVTVIGTNFQPNMSVGVTFPNGGTSTLSGSQVQNVTGSSFLMRITFGTTGTWAITVRNPDGKISNTLSFTVRSVTQLPQISSISPTSPVVRNNDQEIAVYGSNFLPNLSVTIAFPTGGGTTLTGAQIQNVTSSAFVVRLTLATSGVWTMRVNNVAGASSNTFSFNVITPTGVPSISAIDPSTPVVNGLPASSIAQSQSIAVHSLMASNGSFQNIVVRGTNFQPALTVEVVQPASQLLVLQGPSQVQNITPTSFSLPVTFSDSGNYSIRVKNPDGTQSTPFGFTVTPPSTSSCSTSVTYLSQRDTAWNRPGQEYDGIGLTIDEKGCAMTCLTMALNFAGMHLDPGTLNEYMRQNSGYEKSGAVRWGIVSSVSAGQLAFHSLPRTNSLLELEKALCSGFPVVVGVDLRSGNPNHFVLVTGKQADQFLIADPYFPNRTKLVDYQNVFSLRGYVEPVNSARSRYASDSKLTIVNPASNNGTLRISAPGNVELLIIDSSGRRTGFDPLTSVVLTEISDSEYVTDELTNDETGEVSTASDRTLTISGIADGIYQLIVTGEAVGSSNVSITTLTSSGSVRPIASILSVTQTGSTATYVVNVANLSLPVLITEPNSSRALALDSVTLMADPFPVITLHNFSSDQRTRIMLFGSSIDWPFGGAAPSVTVVAKDAQQVTYPLAVEAVRKVPSMDWLTQIVVKLPDALIGKGEVQISIAVGGVNSQPATVRIQ